MFSLILFIFSRSYLYSVSSYTYSVSSYLYSVWSYIYSVSFYTYSVSSYLYSISSRLYSVSCYIYSVSSYLYSVRYHVYSVSSYFIQSSFLYSVSHTVWDDIVPQMLSFIRFRNNQIELTKRQMQKWKNTENRILNSNENNKEKAKILYRWHSKLHTDDIVNKSVVFTITETSYHYSCLKKGGKLQ